MISVVLITYMVNMCRYIYLCIIYFYILYFHAALSKLKPGERWRNASVSRLFRSLETNRCLITYSIILMFPCERVNIIRYTID
jgi:hypothetical protein